MLVMSDWLSFSIVSVRFCVTDLEKCLGRFSAVVVSDKYCGSFINGIFNPFLLCLYLSVFSDL